MTTDADPRAWMLGRLEELVATAKAADGSSRIARILETSALIRDRYDLLELQGRHKAILAEYRQLLFDTPPPRKNSEQWPWRAHGNALKRRWKLKSF